MYYIIQTINIASKMLIFLIFFLNPLDIKPIDMYNITYKRARVVELADTHV